MNPKNELFHWQFDDRRERSTLWYTIALSVVIGLSIWWFLTKQYGMSFIVLLIAWLVYFVENNSEDTITVWLYDLGVSIWKSFYDYSKINSFSVVYQWETPILLRLQFNTKGIKTTDLTINSEVLPTIKEILNEFIPEWKNSELTFTEKIITKLKL